jgi:AcrR family transcriptional regulator
MTATADIISTPREATASRAYAEAIDHLYATAAASFARPTALPGDVAAAGPGATGRGTAAATVADPAITAELADAPELRAIEELRAWLRITYDDVARAVGLSGPSLLHHWRQRQRTGSPVRPRAATVERLWRVHALVRALAEAMEGAPQGNATRLWFRRAVAGVTPLELLFAGDVDEVERRARRLLFDSAARSAPLWQLAVLEQDDELEPAPAPPSPTYEDSDFA